MARILLAIIILAALALTVFSAAIRFDTSFTLLMALIALAVVAALGRGRVRESLFTIFFAGTLAFSLYLYVIGSRSLFLLLAFIIGAIGLLLPVKRVSRAPPLEGAKPPRRTTAKTRARKRAAKPRASRGRKSRRRRPK